MPGSNIQEPERRSITKSPAFAGDFAENSACACPLQVTKLRTYASRNYFSGT